MFSTVAAFLVIFTGVMVFRVKTAVDFRDWDAVWLRSALTLPLAVASGMACWTLIHNPELAAYRQPNHMGAGWDCAYYGKGGAVCFKQQQSK
jgi:hypothetical protein